MVEDNARSGFKPIFDITFVNELDYASCICELCSTTLSSKKSLGLVIWASDAVERIRVASVGVILVQ